jgi:hypothetical protein
MTSFSKRIVDFANSPEYRELTAYFNRSSIFTSIACARNENIHSNFIAWLLSTKNGLGDYPLKQFLKLIALSSKNSSEIINALLTEDYTLADIRVEREKHIGNGRLDIYISGKLDNKPLKILVENKIKSSENDTQTLRYKEWASQFTDSLVFLVYLTPLNQPDYEKLNEPQCECKDFVQINYQGLSDIVIEPCKNLANREIKERLENYLTCLSTPETRQTTGEIIMAYTKEETDLLNRFWKKNRDILIAIITSVTATVDVEEEEREALNKFGEYLKKPRYFWRYKDKGNGDLSMGKLVYEVVTEYVSRHKDISLQELRTVFPNSIQGSFGVFRTLQEIDDKGDSYKKRYSKPIILNDVSIVTSKEWSGNANFLKFKEKAEELGYEIDFA